MSAEQRFGPNSAAIERMLERLGTATPEELRAVGDARRGVWRGPWGVAWNTVKKAGRREQWNAAWLAAWNASRKGGRPIVSISARFSMSGAMLAVLVRDLLPPKHFATLTAPWAKVFGPTWEER
jgi:hypothetical protein